MSLTLFDQRGCLLRTCLLSALGERIGYSGTWNNSATPAGRWWWVLSTSAHPTDDTGSGSWVTPAVHEPGMHFERIVDREGNPPAHLNQRLFDKHTGRMVQDGLIQQVGMAGQWMSPTAGCATGGNTSRSGDRIDELLLTGQVKQAAGAWPTPSAMDGDRGAETKETRGSGGINLREACNWPTPRAEDSEQSGMSHARAAEGIADTLTAAGRQWTTPQAHDAQGTPTASRHGRYGSKHGGRNLPDQIAADQAWNTPSAQDAKNATLPPSLRGRDSVVGQCLQDHTSTRGKPRGSLNPKWVAQLMGYPDGWLAISDEAGSRLSATRSSPSASRSSPEA